MGELSKKLQILDFVNVNKIIALVQFNTVTATLVIYDQWFFLWRHGGH